MLLHTNQRPEYCKWLWARWVCSVINNSFPVKKKLPLSSIIGSIKTSRRLFLPYATSLGVHPPGVWSLRGSSNAPTNCWTGSTIVWKVSPVCCEKIGGISKQRLPFCACKLCPTHPFRFVASSDGRRNPGFGDDKFWHFRDQRDKTLSQIGAS